jgi:hypothetical protein
MGRPPDQAPMTAHLSANGRCPGPEMSTADRSRAVTGSAGRDRDDGCYQRLWLPGPLPHGRSGLVSLQQGHAEAVEPPRPRPLPDREKAL